MKSSCVFLGDGSKWLVATKDAVVGDFYSKKDRQVIKSSLNSNVHTAKWSNRDNIPQDPWVSLVDSHAGSADESLYKEASATGHKDNVRDNNGANVYIRYKGKIFFRSL